ncbi:MAG: hypothetical protein COB02_16745 [Candidatus Cloacimonadota bacterium]|nr:MAG: hypothetical protein COB02_16745 [Candidatus Cloacimonadota bacterium]
MKFKSKLYAVIFSTLCIGLHADKVISNEKLTLKKGSFKLECMSCHRTVDKNFKKRTLIGEHEKLKVNHGDMWCFSCHDQTNRNKLKLIDGSLVDSKDVVQVCAQCHGMVKRDWDAGVHGKRTGYWNGEKEVLACIKCHDPHQPPFAPMKPFSPPRNRFGPIKKEQHKKNHH